MKTKQKKKEFEIVECFRLRSNKEFRKQLAAVSVWVAVYAAGIVLLVKAGNKLLEML